MYSDLSAFSAFLSFFILPSCYAAIGPITSLQVVNKVIKPDGFSRSATLANGVFPGPIISGFKGDVFQIDVGNHLTDKSMELGTSVHFHGIHQNGTNSMDGTSFVTQCPLVPNESFSYNFNVANQAGTYWYHSHLSTQYCDGLRGPFIVYDRNDPHGNLYDVDDDSTVITLSDWYHTPAPAAGMFPVPDSTLFNGLGRYINDTNAPLAIINVEYGKRYRIRLVSAVCHPNYIFSIDGHNMTVIEADGENTEPLTVDSIQIFAGQRYSFVLEATQPVNNYWIRAQPNMGNTNFTGGLNSAVLRYNGARDADPASIQSPSVMPLQETNLHALDNPAAPGVPEFGGADIEIFLNVTWDRIANYYVNNYTWVNPQTPVLLQILSGAMQATDLLPKGSVYTLPRNKVVEVTIPGGGAGSPHPYHLHGHTFSVVRSAGSNLYNYKNPVRRDVVNSGADAVDNMTFRFVTDSPGPWFLHCHLDWHLATGLAVVFVEDTENTASYNSVSNPWEDLCPSYTALGVQY